MKTIPLIISTILINCYSGLSQTKSLMKEDLVNKEILLVHPEAERILQSDFYWNQEDPNNPFVTKDKISTFKVFEQWRLKHTNETPVNFLPKYSTDEMTQYRNETDSYKIEEFYSKLYSSQKKLIDKDKDVLVRIELSPNDYTKATAAQKDAIKEKAVKEISYVTLIDEDNLIISVGFGQLILEGTIDRELKTLTEKALQRQLTPFVLHAFPNQDHIALRQSDLTLMLQDLKGLD